jgi:hypothetical protein
MRFEMRPSWRIVVIGPYRWSAVEIKRLMGYNNQSIGVNNEEEKGEYFTKFVGLIEHKECCAPSHIAV